MSSLNKRMSMVAAVCGLALAGSSGCALLSMLLQGVGLLPPASSPLSLLALMAQAEQLVVPQYPSAILVEVVGAPSSGSATVSSDVDRWQFRFPENPMAVAGTVWVDYENGQLSGPFYTEQGLLGTVFEVLPRTMDLDQAIQKMRDAGYTEAFTAVSFRKPLTFPLPEEALYAFSVPGRFILVGALTGNVTTETPTEGVGPSAFFTQP